MAYYRRARRNNAYQQALRGLQKWTKRMVQAQRKIDKYKKRISIHKRKERQAEHGKSSYWA